MAEDFLYAGERARGDAAVSGPGSSAPGYAATAAPSARSSSASPACSARAGAAARAATGSALARSDSMLSPYAAFAFFDRQLQTASLGLAAIIARSIRSRLNTPSSGQRSALASSLLAAMSSGVSVGTPQTSSTAGGLERDACLEHDLELDRLFVDAHACADAVLVGAQVADRSSGGARARDGCKSVGAGQRLAKLAVGPRSDTRKSMSIDSRYSPRRSAMAVPPPNRQRVAQQPASSASRTRCDAAVVRRAQTTGGLPECQSQGIDQFALARTVSAGSMCRQLRS